MKQVGVFYGSSSGKTADIAGRIQEKLGADRADLRDVADSDAGELMNYDFLILGIPTWGIGEMQEDWEAWIPAVREMDLSDKAIALFGLGDQESYPGTFADGMGRLYEVLKSTGCSFTGSWAVNGYAFEGSSAVVDGNFVGLVLDEENQSEKTEERIDRWLKEIKQRDA